jgi:hypothetical protein
MRRQLKRSLLALGFMLVAVPTTQADREFSNADLRGPYGFSFELTIVATGRRVVGIRQFTADGEGTFSGEGTSNAGAGGLHLTFDCTYSVSPNGTGTAACTATPGAENFAFVLVDEGKEVHFISTTPGVLLRGVARKQSSRGKNGRGGE